LPQTIRFGKVDNMAKYTVTHKCGHTQQHVIYGSNRDWELKRLAEQVCAACYKEALLKDDGKDVAWAQESGLPALIGSEKQIPWANSIRRGKWAELDKEEERFNALAAQAAAEHTEYIAQIKAAFQTVRSEDRAAWWIEHKSASVQDMLKLYVK
jgi:hypothetical protein